MSPRRDPREGRKWCMYCDREIIFRLGRWCTFQGNVRRCDQSPDGAHAPG